MSFNIYDLAAKEYAVLEVLHPVTKVPTGAKLTVAGPASDEYEIQKTRLAELLKQGDLTSAQAGAENTKFLAGCVTGWEGMGVEYSPEAVQSLLANKKMYAFKNWLDTEITNVANFITA